MIQAYQQQIARRNDYHIVLSQIPHNQACAHAGGGAGDDPGVPGADRQRRGGFRAAGVDRKPLLQRQARRRPGALRPRADAEGLRRCEFPKPLSRMPAALLLPS